jgi:hypothetical protein
MCCHTSLFITDHLQIVPVTTTSQIGRVPGFACLCYQTLTLDFFLPSMCNFAQPQIVPVTTTFTDRNSGEKSTITVTADDGPREGITAAGVAKLKAVFQKGGSTTAGNASQVSGCFFFLSRCPKIFPLFL